MGPRLTNILDVNSSRIGTAPCFSLQIKLNSISSVIPAAASPDLSGSRNLYVRAGLKPAPTFTLPLFRAFSPSPPTYHPYLFYRNS